jgi:hypothetical protein
MPTHKSTKLFEYNGQMLSRNAIAKLEGVSRQAIHQRLKAGDILTKAARNIPRAKPQNARPTKAPMLHAFKGERLSVADIANREGVHVAAIQWRIKTYGTAEKRPHVSHCSRCKSHGHNKLTCRLYIRTK